MLRYSKRNSEVLIRLAAGLLRQGELIVYPTDTVYGIGADATNRRAVAKVFALKKRSRSKPLSIMVSDTAMLKRYAKTVRGFKKGRYTFIIEPKKRLPVSKYDIGFRLPNHWCAKIAKELGRPVVTTSANVSERPVARTAKEAKKLFGDKIALYIDGGRLSGKPSKVVCLSTGKMLR
jgi:L-threonylcarbamoyladenylate synthase